MGFSSQVSLEGFKECQYFSPSISWEYWHPGEGFWDLEGRFYILFSPSVWVGVHSSATALLLWSRPAQTPDSGGAAGHEAGLTPSVCTTVLRWVETPMLLAHMAEASLHRHQSGLGVRCDGWTLFVFSCQWDLAGVLNYSPPEVGWAALTSLFFRQAHVCACMFLPRAGSVTLSSEGEELLSAVSVSSTASGGFGFTACTMWPLEHTHTLHFSVSSVCLKATDW